MQIEAGKYYRTRDGRKVGPMKRLDGATSTYPWEGLLGDWLLAWTGSGEYVRDNPHHHPADLIAEWVDEPAAPSPVRTVTRKEIVPGQYGRVLVGGSEGVYLYIYPPADRFSASELRAAAKVFTDIADALDQENE